MADLLKRGQQLQADALMRFGAETITYRRRSDSVEIAASPAPPDLTFGSQFGGTLLRGDRREWLIKADSLILNGQTVSPLANDLIDVAGDDGKTRRYRVSKDDTLPEFQPVDAFGILIRIRAVFEKVIHG